MSEAIRILHVDDNPSFCDLTREFLQREDSRFEVVSENSPTDALNRIQTEQEQLDCLLSDYNMPEMNGLEFLETLQQQFPDFSAPFILLTGEGNEDVAAEALNIGASSYIQKGNPEVYEYVATRIRHDLETEQAYRDSQRFDTLLSAIDDPFYILDGNGRFSYVNNAFCDLTGYDRATIRGSDPSLVKDEQAVAVGEKYLAQLLSNDGPDSTTFEVKIQPKNGDAIHCEDRMSVLPYEGEEFRGSLGVLRDISERKAREQQLREAKERYQLLVEQSLIGLYISRGTEIIYHNPKFAELFGCTDEANVLASESLSERVQPADRDRLADNLGEVMIGDRDSIREPFVGVQADGDTINIELLARKIELDGEPAVIGTVVDADEDDQSYWQLRRERDRLEAFTSIVSHDLRTPLSVAQGRIELVLQELTEGSAVESLEDADRALRRMEAMLGELLTLAKQGEVVADTEPASIQEIAESTWENVETADAHLHVSTDNSIEADPGRMKSLFENLYKNAVEHGRSDITLRVGASEEGIYIEDDGPGIPADVREEVFEPGYSSSEEGTGFGLSIVEEIVEAHGWEIGITEAESGGARFDITGVEFAE
ncbi:hybrid sensor histidine kinase/response regulator [Halorubrum sp. 48-1-W]|uniref:hybrid sensor histidine kinase/response regulator n=1 Tax=Halorubrum sp. 48-1-W TaxID=2249761 RepID=UPI000DCDFE5F|nr:PAS domain S-box protein [Halorubrum sp. 48-1-W]RAW44347.1 hybrid sensor histidine kinase/response regulator [Halorubrum sp. 48-1-W]